MVPRLDDQLDEQARTFFRNSEKNRIPTDDDRIALSRILKWYGEDFETSQEDLQRFIARYFESTVQSRLEDVAYERPTR